MFNGIRVDVVDLLDGFGWVEDEEREFWEVEREEWYVMFGLKGVDLGFDVGIGEFLF